MESPKLLSLFRCLQPLFLLTILLFSSSIETKLHISRLSPRGPLFSRDGKLASQPVAKDFKTHFYNQTLDHFNYKPESYEKFRQRYVVNSKYWGGASSSAPIFVFFGAEEPLDDDLSQVGFSFDYAPHLNALLVYIEHRYYGKSMPFGSAKEALKNASTLGYFNSAQAIADYAEIILHVKKMFHAKYSPVIVYGGSYGGELAAWFRLKYPHITLGAWASSAPILYYDDITPQDGYLSIVSKDFKESSESCYKTIKKSWAEIDKVASQTSNGLTILSKKFKTCKPLKNSKELKDHLEYMYCDAAQYNAPPNCPVDKICRAMDGRSGSGDSNFRGEKDLLGKIFDGLVAFQGNKSCYVNPPNKESEADLAWYWQTCSEMVVPIGLTRNDTMFTPSPFDLESYIDDCKNSYGITPRSHWITTYYVGHSIKLILKRFGSNIIFSNGLKDPYSSGGVLENISDSIVAVTTTNGSHCLDFARAKKTDPYWLVEQRETVVRIIKGWIKQYYADLRENNKQ